MLAALVSISPLAGGALTPSTKRDILQAGADFPCAEKYLGPRSTSPYFLTVGDRKSQEKRKGL
jgi:hypothetical protein